MIRMKYFDIPFAAMHAGEWEISEVTADMLKEFK